MIGEFFPIIDRECCKVLLWYLSECALRFSNKTIRCFIRGRVANEEIGFSFYKGSYITLFISTFYRVTFPISHS